MWHAFKKNEGKVVVASSMELKAKDIRCSGWEVEIGWCRNISSSEMGGKTKG